MGRTYAGSKPVDVDEKLRILRRVLYAVVRRNPTVGYCQVLNFLVAHLLCYQKEEEVFWTMCSLIESILPIDYYSEMTGVLADQKLFSNLFKMTIHQLWHYLQKLGVDPSLISLQWFICLFSYNLQPGVRTAVKRRCRTPSGTSCSSEGPRCSFMLPWPSCP